MLKIGALCYIKLTKPPFLLTYIMLNMLLLFGKSFEFVVIL